MNQPLRPLLVKHPMSTFLAPDLIASLQRHARVTLSTEISDNRAIDGACKTLGAKGVLSTTQRGDLISFARHSGFRWGEGLFRCGEWQRTFDFSWWEEWVSELGPRMRKVSGFKRTFFGFLSFGLEFSAMLLDWWVSVVGLNYVKLPR